MARLFFVSRHNKKNSPKRHRAVFLLFGELEAQRLRCLPAKLALFPGLERSNECLEFVHGHLAGSLARLDEPLDRDERPHFLGHVVLLYMRGLASHIIVVPMNPNLNRKL